MVDKLRSNWKPTHGSKFKLNQSTIKTKDFAPGNSGLAREASSRTLLTNRFVVFAQTICFTTSMAMELWTLLDGLKLATNYGVCNIFHDCKIILRDLIPSKKYTLRDFRIVVTYSALSFYFKKKKKIKENILSKGK